MLSLLSSCAIRERFELSSESNCSLRSFNIFKKIKTFGICLIIEMTKKQKNDVKKVFNKGKNSKKFSKKNKKAIRNDFKKKAKKIQPVSSTVCFYD